MIPLSGLYLVGVFLAGLLIGIVLSGWLRGAYPTVTHAEWRRQGDEIIDKLNLVSQSLHETIAFDEKLIETLEKKGDETRYAETVIRSNRDMLLARLGIAETHNEQLEENVRLLILREEHEQITSQPSGE
jgi:hypothetical protein